jgi:YbbR domain-containing protein
VRVLRFIVHNWPLKIGAVLLAVTLYGAMVVLQGTQVWPGKVAIQPVNQPTTGYLLGTLPEVSDIRYIASPDVPVSQSSFVATIDLAGVKVSESAFTLVPVELTATDQRIQIVDYQPQQIKVTLDPIVSKKVPVEVSYASVPSGLQPGTPIFTPSTVEISGGASIVRTVSEAQASVRIDASGLDVNQDVGLVALDASGHAVDNVTIDPRTVHVDIQVGSQIRSETVPVNPVLSGTPAAGYYVTAINVTPSVVSVRGQADALALLNGKANTKAISVAGATGDITANVPLNLPAGVTSDTTASITVAIHLSSPNSSRSYSVGVVLAGARPNIVYSLSTPSVIVTLGGPTAALNALDTSTLVAVASVADLGPGAHAVTLTITVPPGITVDAISPGQITVTVVNPPSPPPVASPTP